MLIQKKFMLVFMENSLKLMSKLLLKFTMNLKVDVYVTDVDDEVEVEAVVRDEAVVEDVDVEAEVVVEVVAGDEVVSADDDVDVDDVEVVGVKAEVVTEVNVKVLVAI